MQEGVTLLHRYDRMLRSNVHRIFGCAIMVDPLEVYMRGCSLHNMLTNMLHNMLHSILLDMLHIFA